MNKTSATGHDIQGSLHGSFSSFQPYLSISPAHAVQQLYVSLASSPSIMPFCTPHVLTGTGCPDFVPGKVLGFFLSSTRNQALFPLLPSPQEQAHHGSHFCTVLCLLFVSHPTRPRTLEGQRPYFFILISKFPISPEYLEGTAPCPSLSVPTIQNSHPQDNVQPPETHTGASMSSLSRLPLTSLPSACVPLPHARLHSCSSTRHSPNHKTPQARCFLSGQPFPFCPHRELLFTCLSFLRHCPWSLQWASCAYVCPPSVGHHLRAALRPSVPFSLSLPLARQRLKGRSHVPSLHPST